MSLDQLLAERERLVKEAEENGATTEEAEKFVRLGKPALDIAILEKQKSKIT